MICIFCGLEHESVSYMCETRQAAMIRRIVLLTARVPNKIQTTIPELYRKKLNKETFIENTQPIAILDSDEEAELPILSLTEPDDSTQIYRQPTSSPTNSTSGDQIFFKY